MGIFRFLGYLCKFQKRYPPGFWGSLPPLLNPLLHWCCHLLPCHCHCPVPWVPPCLLCCPWGEMCLWPARFIPLINKIWERIFVQNLNTNSSQVGVSSYSEVYIGVWSYSALLTAGAMVFFTQPSLRFFLTKCKSLNLEEEETSGLLIHGNSHKEFDYFPPRSLPLHLFAVFITVVLHSALSPILASFHLPIFTLPFVLTSWLFLLFPTGNDTIIRTLETLTPEQRMFRARKSPDEKVTDEATIAKENQLAVAEQGEA